jgi:5,6-dimethylbenzimidazole synthase
MNPPLSVRCLIVLVGPPGSGKTTWARRNRKGAVHLPQDGLIGAITPDGFDPAFCPIYKEAEDAVVRVALRSGRTVIADGTNHTRAHRERWLKIAREESSPAIAVVISTSEDMFAAMEPVQPDEGFAAVHLESGVVEGIRLPQGFHFSDEERRGVYRAIYERRDVRSQFLHDAIPDHVLGRILDAAHHAPSVGFMQPWDFLVIRDAAVRQEVYRNFESANRRAAGIYQGEQRKLYDGLKLAGILEAPVNVCVTCDHERLKGSGLGRQTDPAVDLYSTVCAVQNLWLAARAESIGVGWVSILNSEQLKSTLGIPPGLTLVAYLCMGYVSEFRPQPDLEEKGWETRGSLADVTHFDRWGVHANGVKK